MPTYYNTRTTPYRPWDIYTPALLYGTLLLSLLFRKKDGGDLLDAANMPGFLTPFLTYSLHFAIVLVAIIVVRNISTNKLKLPKPYIILYLFSIFFYNLRVFDASEMLRSFVGSALPLLMLIAISNKINIEKQSEILRNSLAVCFAGFTLINTSLLILGYGYHGFRFSGITFHPNQLGLAAGLASIFFTASIFTTKSLIHKQILTILLLLSAALLLASGSRGALLATTLGIIFHLVVERKILPIIIILAICLLTTGALSILDPDNLSFLQSRLVDSNDNRSEVWSRMISGFLQSPIIGMGLDAVGSESSILKALSVGGLICGFPVALMTFKLLSSSIQYFFNKMKNKEDSVYYCLLGCILVASLLDGYLFEMFGFTTTLLLIVLAYTSRKPRRRKPTTAFNSTSIQNI